MYPYVAGSVLVLTPFVRSNQTGGRTGGLSLPVNDTSLLILYVIIHSSYLFYASVFIIRSTHRSKQHMKFILFLLMIFGSVAYLLFVIMTMILDPDEFGVNGDGGAYVTFWTSWTSWIICFLMICDPPPLD